jgi:hypothetical protein
LSGWRDRVREWLSVEEEELIEEDEEFEPELDVSNDERKVVYGSTGEPVEVVVERLASVEGKSIVEASRILYYMGQRGDIWFEDTDPPVKLADFFLSWYSAWFWVVAGFQVLVGLAVFVFPQTVPWVYVRYVSGAVYVLYVPGAVFIEMLYPKRDELEDLERFALGVGLSLALVPLVGLVLNYTPWGIRLNPIFAGLALIVMVFSLAAVYRKYGYFALSQEA